MSLVEIRRFADVNEAEIARGYLASQGVEAWVAGDQHARIDPLMQQALGWTRLSVSASQAKEAQSLLEAVRPLPVDQDTAVTTHPASRKLTVLAIAGLVLTNPYMAWGLAGLRNRPGWIRNLGVGSILVVITWMIVWAAASFVSA